jgi:glucose-6-phosphate 1-dehydrogenase
VTGDGGACGAVRPADPCALVIFGATGDLTRRKLLPALHSLARHGFVVPELPIVGVAVDPLSDEAFRARVAEAVRSLGTGAFDGRLLAAQQARCGYVAGRFDDPATYARLRERLAAIHRDGPTQGNTLFYLATPPAFFATIAEQLGAAGLVRRQAEASGWTRVIVEKPFGRDLASARALNRRLLAVFDEAQIHRIDHYLGKETVQNILLLRFLNGVFEPVWNRRYVDHVQITVAETLGVEGRGGYYETAGALRDMVQSHMLQLVCLVAMEPPISLVGEAVRDEKVKVLRAIRPPAAEEIAAVAVRGQYGPGQIDGRPVPGYREEPHVARDSVTETFAALRLYIENWRWAEVPFYLRTGKRLAAHDTEIVVQFRRAPLALLPPEAGPQQPNRLTIHIQPDERITLRIEAKRPGPHLRMVPVELEFAYEDLEGDSRSTGYETLLYDCMIGDPMLFHRADMVEAAWTVVTPILEAWAAEPPRDFPNYAAGSWGPAAADRLLARDGRRWVPPA